MVHGFQFIEIWQRHSVDCDDDCLGSLTLFKSTSGIRKLHYLFASYKEYIW